MYRAIFTNVKQNSKPGLWHVFSTLPHRNRFLLVIKANDKKVPLNHNQGDFTYILHRMVDVFWRQTKRKKEKRDKQYIHRHVIVTPENRYYEKIRRGESGEYSASK
jgi:hypothetical protein